MRWLSQVLAVSTCLLALEGVSTSAEAQVLTFTANQGAKRLKTQTSVGSNSTASTVFTTLTSTTVSTPSTGTFRIVATFSGESACNATSWCTLRILVDGVEMNPVVGTNFAFDSPGGETWDSHSIQRTSGELSPGTKTVTVQFARVGGAGAFTVDDWQLTIEVWKIS